MNVDRREFLKVAAGSTLALAASSPAQSETEPKPLCVGVIGLGRRGSGLLGSLLQMRDVRVPAVCDIDKAATGRAQGMVTKAGQPEPEAVYTRRGPSTRNC